MRLTCVPFVFSTLLSPHAYYYRIAPQAANRWEEEQLMKSGVVRRTEVALTFDSEEETRVHLLVHDLQPPFLDGRVVFTKQADPVCGDYDYSHGIAVCD